MEGKEKKTNEVNMVLVIIIVILLGIVGYCAYRLGDEGRKTIDDTNLEKGGNTSVTVEIGETEETNKIEDKTTLDKVKKVTINYTLQNIDNQNSDLDRYKIIVNGVDTTLITFNNPIVYTMDDALVIMAKDPRAAGDISAISIVDQNGKIINEIVSWDKNAKTNKFILLEGDNIWHNPQMNDKTLTVETASLGNSDQGVVCSSTDDFIVEYTHVMDYLGNGEFSEPKIIKKVTAKEYKITHNITC